MAKRLTFKQFLFVLPLLLIVSVFSLYPIVTSFVYTAFDYRTNDPQYAGLYVSDMFNAELFVQDTEYLVFFLENEATVVEGEALQEIRQLQQDMEAFIAPYKAATGTLSISETEVQEINGFLDDVETRLDALYAENPDIQFFHAQDMPVLLGEMRRCFIEPNLTGANNYSALMQDARFWSSLVTTLVFTLISVGIEFVLGMALALIMNKAIKAIGLVRTVSLIPWAIPTAVAALIWSFLYDGSNGIVAHLFASIHLIPSSQSMLLTAGGAMASAILADVWKTTPYMALLLLAGLQVIDRVLYESASVDGSGKINTFFRITLPLMKPSILVALLFRLLDAFRVYDLLAVLTGGGPGGATETLSIYAYKLMIGQGNYGYGSTVVVAMFLCVALIAFFFVKVMGAEVVKNDEK